MCPCASASALKCAPAFSSPFSFPFPPPPSAMLMPLFVCSFVRSFIRLVGHSCRPPSPLFISPFSAIYISHIQDCVCVCAGCVEAAAAAAEAEMRRREREFNCTRILMTEGSLSLHVDNYRFILYLGDIKDDDDGDEIREERRMHANEKLLSFFFVAMYLSAYHWLPSEGKLSFHCLLMSIGN